VTKLAYEREDVYNLEFPEVILSRTQRREILNHLYLFHEISLPDMAEKIGLEPEKIKQYLKLLIQSMILRGYYRNKKFIVSTFYKYPFIEEIKLSENQLILLSFLIPIGSTQLSDLANLLNVSREQIIRELKTLISHGLLIAQVKKNKIVAKWIWTPPEELELSDTHIKIVGTAMMLRKADIYAIARQLNLKSKKVLFYLGQLLIHRKVEGELTFESHFFGKNRLTFFIRRFIISPEKKDLTTLPTNEKEAVGYLLLTKRAPIKEISKFIEKTRAETVGIFATLTAKGTFQSIFTSPDTIRPLMIPDIKPSRTIEEMATLSFFNYEALLGVLTTKKRISIRKLANTMHRSEDEIIEALINLLLEGFVSCTKQGNVIVTDTIYRYSRAQEGSLERWEKIVLGMIIAKTIISVKDIATSLGIDKTIAREKLYAFYGKGLIKGEIVGNKLIPEEIPVFPPLNQLEDFPIHYQEIFGFLISNVHVNTGKMAKIWNKSANAIKNVIYELTGAGLINIIQKGNNITVESSQRYYPSLELKTLGEEYVQIINEIEKSRRKKIKLTKIQQRVNIPPLDIFKIICQLLAHGYYKGKITTSFFIKEGKLILPARKMKCYYCGHTIESTHIPCPNCTKLQPLCSVCNGAIKHGEEILECPNCENVGHKEHLKKWIAIKTECPVCKTKISERNLKAKIA